MRKTLQKLAFKHIIWQRLHIPVFPLVAPSNWYASQIKIKYTVISRNAMRTHPFTSACNVAVSLKMSDSMTVFKSEWRRECLRGSKVLQEDNDKLRMHWKFQRNCECPNSWCTLFVCLISSSANHGGSVVQCPPNLFQCNGINTNSLKIVA